MSIYKHNSLDVLILPPMCSMSGQPLCCLRLCSPDVVGGGCARWDKASHGVSRLLKWDSPEAGLLIIAACNTPGQAFCINKVCTDQEASFTCFINEMCCISGSEVSLYLLGHKWSLLSTMCDSGSRSPLSYMMRSMSCLMSAIKLPACKQWSHISVVRHAPEVWCTCIAVGMPTPQGLPERLVICIATA